jgi:hypothetical protein
LSQLILLASTRRNPLIGLMLDDLPPLLVLDVCPVTLDELLSDD